ncbi:Smr domain protein [Treponema primitia ZAS-2]|uniref:Smr domain protein n=1 Tax=Treponema primitia (strain ATCC BAA-887 / DSM 12427 / ZAS-2) TaxID=545694 RepID=F5YKW4_TREPZ|nr:Smr/MutS family protein [Treponema primitia]AEF83698.1 Smr domain protein [Treponema primitia ZAS-2]
MDFGEILDEWDRQTGKPAGKKALKKALQRNPENPDVSGADQQSEQRATKFPAQRATPALAGEFPAPLATPALAGEFPAQRVDPLTAWLRVNGISDKDAEDAENAQPPGERRRRLLAKKPDATIDLHGLTRDEAWLALESFFRVSQQQGFEKLLIIHGKGNHTDGEAVLKRSVRDFIERCHYAGESGYSPAVDGGTGSTWVILKDEG